MYAQSGTVYTIDFDGGDPLTYEIIEGTLGISGAETGSGIYNSMHIRPPGIEDYKYWDSFVVIEVPLGEISNVKFRYLYNDNFTGDSTVRYVLIYPESADPEDKYADWIHTPASAIEWHGNIADPGAGTWHTFDADFNVNCTISSGCRVAIFLGTWSSDYTTYTYEYKLDNIEITVGGLPTATPTSTPREIISNVNTPTVTPTANQIDSSLPTLVPTPTQAYNCPAYGNPWGYGYITPDPRWELVCGSCIQGGNMPTVTPDGGSCSGSSCSFQNPCAAILTGSTGPLDEIPGMGTPGTLQVPGLTLGDPECMGWDEWEISWLTPVFGFSSVGLPAMQICAIPFSFGDLSFFGYTLDVDWLLATVWIFRLLWKLWAG